MRASVARYLSDPENKQSFNIYVKGSYRDLFGGDDVDAIIEKLNSYTDLALHTLTKGTGLFLSYEAYHFISKYKMEIEKLNYYAWARFLEKVNDDDALIRVLEKLELATPQRKDLSMYRDILYKEFQEDRCFYCGKRLDTKIHVDHFIPWSFVKNDNLWNFVLSCPKCNLQKSGHLVSHDYIIKIEKRNDIIIENSTRPLILNEFNGYYNGLLDRMWSYAKMSGIRENTRLNNNH